MKQTLTDRIESLPTWLLAVTSFVTLGISIAIALFTTTHILFISFGFLTAMIIYLLLEFDNQKLFFYFTLGVWIILFMLWMYAGFRSVFIWECLVGTNGLLLGSTERCQTGEIYLSLMAIPAIYQVGYWIKTHVKLQTFPRRVLHLGALGGIGVILSQILVYGASALALLLTVYGIVFR